MKDQFGRDITYLRLSVTDLCNLRCRYCMPEEGVCSKSHFNMLTEDEMVMAAEVAAELGVTRIRITGGEPLVKKNIISICRRISAIPGIREVTMTTNATLLEDCAEDLKRAGVSRLNISLDTLDPDRFEHITRRNQFEQAMSGIRAAEKAGFGSTKINAVLIGGFNDDEIVKLSELTLDKPIDVRFIELMPMYDGGDFGKDAFIPCDMVLDRLREADYEPMPLETEGVARLYRLPGAVGRIGLISPVSKHFCAECNRLRLTADGKIRPCLHSGIEYSIKGLNREEMAEQFRLAIENKPAEHAELSYTERSQAGRNMNTIGG